MPLLMSCILSRTLLARNEPAQINHRGDCSAMERLETICLMLLNLQLCYYLPIDWIEWLLAG